MKASKTVAVILTSLVFVIGKPNGNSQRILWPNWNYKTDCESTHLVMESLQRLLYKIGDKANVEDLGCPPGFHRFNSTCYYFGILQVNWYTAKSLCNDMGGNLAIIENYAQDQFIVESVLNKRVSQTFLGYWIDGRDKKKNNRWVWDKTESPLKYTRWHKGQPDNNGDCLFLWIYNYEFNWADHHCTDEKMGFICQMDSRLPEISERKGGGK